MSVKGFHEILKKIKNDRLFSSEAVELFASCNGQILTLELSVHPSLLKSNQQASLPPDRPKSLLPSVNEVAYEKAGKHISKRNLLIMMLVRCYYYLIDIKQILKSLCF